MPAASLAQLDEVAEELNAHPEIEKVAVEGHTDDRASVAENTALAQARADAVRGHLIKRGVAKSRLVARGHGQGEPVVPNTTARGRTVNRRVEFRILELKAETPR